MSGAGVRWVWLLNFPIPGYRCHPSRTNQISPLFLFCEDSGRGGWDPLVWLSSVSLKTPKQSIVKYFKPSEQHREQKNSHTTAFWINADSLPYLFQTFKNKVLYIHMKSSLLLLSFPSQSFTTLEFDDYLPCLVYRYYCMWMYLYRYFSIVEENHIKPKWPLMWDYVKIHEPDLLVLILINFRHMVWNQKQSCQIKYVLYHV